MIKIIKNTKYLSENYVHAKKLPASWGFSRLTPWHPVLDPAGAKPHPLFIVSRYRACYIRVSACKCIYRRFPVSGSAGGDEALYTVCDTDQSFVIMIMKKNLFSAVGRDPSTRVVYWDKRGSRRITTCPTWSFQESEMKQHYPVKEKDTILAQCIVCLASTAVWHLWSQQCLLSTRRFQLQIVDEAAQQDVSL